jgi:hypothetical protein
VRFHEHPAARNGEVTGSTTLEHPPDLAQVAKLVLPAADVLDDVVGYDDVEAPVREGELRVLDEREAVAVGHQPLVEDVDGVHGPFRTDTLRERLGHVTRPRADVEDALALERRDRLEHLLDLLRLEEPRVAVEDRVGPPRRAVSSDCPSVGLEGGLHDCLPRAEGADACASSTAETSAQRRVGQQPLDGRAQSDGIPRGHEQAGLAVADEADEAPDGARHHWFSVCHRLGAHDAEAFAAGRADDHGRGGEAAVELLARDEAARLREHVSQGAVAADDEVHPLGRRSELVNPLLGREAAGVEDLERLGLPADASRDLDPVWDEERVARARGPRRVSESLRDAQHGARAIQHRADEPGSAPEQLEVVQNPARDGAVQGEDEGLARQERDEAAGEPVRVHEVGFASSPPKRAHHGPEQERRYPGAALDRPHDPTAVVVEPEGAEDARVDDLDLEPALTQAPNGVRDEASREIVLVPGIRGGEDRDLERLRGRRGCAFLGSGARRRGRLGERAHGA